ncbi:putative thymidylate kinase [Erwinia phage vB_EamM_Stratton]|uniref:Putative thymidylate kinase n=1 Tax=Erwinia phage vB_EamM_Stratton TaxID=1883378 RepID=A0A1B2IH32_9CAUD|nr:putative thymidylate kinase [Erwinia phage vB_EamM_Stratton]
MLRSVSIDAPDFAGKDTLSNLVVGMLRAAGINAVMINHPTNVTEPGIRARNLVGQSAAKQKIAEAMCEDFHITMDVKVPMYDVVIFNRFCISTIAYQGVDGKGEVFRSKVADHPNAPQLYVAIDVDYDTAMARYKKRLAEQGKNWDDEVLTMRYLQDERSWNGLRDAYRFAHQIITEGGDKFPLVNVVSDDNIALTASQIVQRILEG